MIRNRNALIKCDNETCDSTTFNLSVESRLEGLLVTRYATCTICGLKVNIDK